MHFDVLSYLLGMATIGLFYLLLTLAVRIGPLVPYLYAYLYILLSPSERRALAANHIWDRMQWGGMAAIDGGAACGSVTRCHLSVGA